MDRAVNIDRADGRSCHSCIFWGGEIYPPAGRSTCRRSPPTVVGERVDGSIRAMWPMTASDGWCGEHRLIPGYRTKVRDVPLGAVR